MTRKQAITISGRVTMTRALKVKINNIWVKNFK